MSWGVGEAPTTGPSTESPDAAPTIDLGRPPGVDPRLLWSCLRSVIDPELGVNVVDLGLVYEAEVRTGIARIVMTTTSPACPIGGFLEDAVRWSLLELPGVVDVEIELTHEPPWTPAHMTDAARRALGMPGP